jgi:DNA-binding IclR family transcriptional regulator
MLQHRGFIYQDPRSKAYLAGPALLEIGIASAQHADLRTFTRPWLEWVRDKTGETVHVVTMRGRDVLFVDGIEGSQVLRVGLHTGTVAPAYSVSAGKALLAELSLPQLYALYPEEALPGITQRSIMARSVLEQELGRTRARGFAIVEGEYEAGVVAVGVVIRDKWERVRFGIAVATPAVRLQTLQLTSIAQVLQEAAGEMQQHWL